MKKSFKTFLLVIVSLQALLSDTTLAKNKDFFDVVYAQGNFEVINKKPAVVYCQFFPSMTLGLLRWHSEIEGCVMEVKRIGVAPKFGNKSSTFKTYANPEACKTAVGGKIQLYMGRHCGGDWIYYPCESYFPPRGKNVDPSIVACQKTDVWWTDPMTTQVIKDLESRPENR